jgi:pimeloyl-ACP methyl ester carboxylesterase
MAPVVNGRTYLRELSAFAGAAEAPGADAGDDLVVAGFRFPAEFAGAVRSIDLRRPEQRPADRIFVMAQRRDHASDMFEANLESLGASVWTSFFVGYDRLMSDCLTSRVAGEVIDAVTDWVSQDAPAGDSRSVDGRSGLLLGSAWREKRVLIDEMAGVLTMPRGTATGRVMLVLNAGATPQQGAGGQVVAYARGLAAEGVATLRIDLPGIGDSPSSHSVRPNLYSPDLRRGLGAVLDWLEARNLRDITLLGVSSGAFQAFEAALEQDRIHRIVLVNPLCFQWSASDALQVETWHRRRANEVANRLREAEQIPAPADIGALAAFALPLAHRFARSSVDALRTLAALGGGSNSVQRRFAQLSQRGVEIVLVHGESDPSREELARWMGPDGVMALALPGVSLHVVPGADHLMTTPAAQSALRDILFATMGAAQKAQAEEAQPTEAKVAAA